ncbi:hypothetical protein QQ045_022760 [Rhodiola kirilowii]
MPQHNHHRILPPKSPTPLPTTSSRTSPPEQLCEHDDNAAHESDIGQGKKPAGGGGNKRRQGRQAEGRGRGGEGYGGGDCGRKMNRLKKLVLKIDMPDDGAKRKAMKTVAGYPGIDSISIDMKEQKLTIIGTVDPTKVVSRLRKYWTTELVSVGPVKDPKEEPKKEESAKKVEEAVTDKKQPAPSADEAKKQGSGGEEKKAEEEPKKEAEDHKEAAKTKGEEERKVDMVVSEMVKAYRAYNPQMTKYYYVQSMEENPNACVIC